MAINDILNIDKIAQDVTRSLFGQKQTNSIVDPAQFQNLLAKSLEASLAETQLPVASTTKTATTAAVEAPTMFADARAYLGTEPLSVVSTPWAGGKPDSIKELMDFMTSRNINMDCDQAVDFLYGSVGSNDDLRDFNAILNATDPIAANNQALGQLFSNPEARTNPNYTPRSSLETIAQSGNLIVRNSGDGNQILAAKAANGMPLSDIVLSSANGNNGLERYGITDTDIQAVLDNPTVSNDLKTSLSKYLGKGYVASNTNYLLNIALPSFASGGVFDQYGAPPSEK